MRSWCSYELWPGISSGKNDDKMRIRGMTRKGKDAYTLDEFTRTINSHFPTLFLTEIWSEYTLSINHCDCVCMRRSFLWDLCMCSKFWCARHLLTKTRAPEKWKRSFALSLPVTLCLWLFLSASLSIKPRSPNTRTMSMCDKCDPLYVSTINCVHSLSSDFYYA